MADRRARTGQTTNHGGQVVNAGAVAVGHVEYARSRGLRGEERIGCHDVLHVNKIACLFAGAVNGDGLVLERMVDEYGNRRRILALGILARAKDVEIAQANGRQWPSAMNIGQ